MVFCRSCRGPDAGTRRAIAGGDLRDDVVDNLSGGRYDTDVIRVITRRTLGASRRCAGYDLVGSSTGWKRLPLMTPMITSLTTSPIFMSRSHASMARCLIMS